MRRLVFIIISAAIIGKIFTFELVRLAENSSTTSENLGQNLILAKEANQQLKLDRIRSNLDIVRKIPASKLVLHNKPYYPAPLPRTVPALAKPTPAPVDPKQKQEEEAKDRRKKRQKDLEEKATEVAQAKSPVSLAAFQPLPVLPEYNTTYAGGLIPGAAINTTANQVSNTAVTTSLPVHVSTTAKTGDAVVAGWIKVLTSNPSPQAMTSFESQYTNGALNSTEYYQVLSAMESSSNSESRNYAVQGAIPYQNISSFKILADESINESNGTLRQTATTAVQQTYDNASFITLLNTAVASGDSAEKTVAEKFLGQIGGAASTAPTTAGVTTNKPTFHF